MVHAGRRGPGRSIARGRVTQTGNPYRWDHHTPGVSIDRTPDFVDAIRRGEVVRLVGGRGMGKSVTLRQIASRFEREPDARVLLIPGPPLRAGEPSDFLADAARRLTLDPHRFETLDQVIDALGCERMLLLLDEMDQYLALEEGRPARTLLNHVEAVRKEVGERLSVVIAGGLGLVHMAHVLGSGLLSRARTVMARPFTRGELEELAKPLRSKRPFDDVALATLHSASGGNPALATYGFECLWPIDGDAVEQLRLIFGTFPTERATFVRAVVEAVSRNGLCAPLEESSK